MYVFLGGWGVVFWNVYCIYKFLRTVISNSSIHPHINWCFVYVCSYNHKNQVKKQFFKNLFCISSTAQICLQEKCCVWILCHSGIFITSSFHIKYIWCLCFIRSVLYAFIIGIVKHVSTICHIINEDLFFFLFFIL